jgi:hypothetical protein
MRISITIFGMNIMPPEATWALCILISKTGNNMYMNVMLAQPL